MGNVRQQCQGPLIRQQAMVVCPGVPQPRHDWLLALSIVLMRMACMLSKHGVLCCSTGVPI